MSGNDSGGQGWMAPRARLAGLLLAVTACGSGDTVHRAGTSISGRASSASTANRVTYHGGRVLSGAQIVVVFWGTHVDRDVVDRTPTTYRTLTELNDFDWISEYDTASQHIQRSSYLGEVVIEPGDAGTRLRDGGTLLLEQDIVTGLVGQLDAGVLPPATEDHYYAVYFPPGVKIEAGIFQDASCEAWSAYHGDLAPASVGTYAVFPACGQTSANAVHELFEAVTDPHDNDGWTTQDGAEIADLCASSLTSLPLRDGGALDIQRLWSDVSGACLGSGNEFNLSIDPHVAPAAPVLTFTLSMTPPRNAYASLGWQVSGLPDGGTSTIRQDGAASWTLTVDLPPAEKAFSFTVEGQTESWTARTGAGVYLGPVSSSAATGCSQSAAGPWPEGLLGVLVLGALGLRRRVRWTRSLKSGESYRAVAENWRGG